jgi:hypothetical protein
VSRRSKHPYKHELLDILEMGKGAKEESASPVNRPYQCTVNPNLIVALFKRIGAHYKSDAYDSKKLPTV